MFDPSGGCSLISAVNNKYSSFVGLDDKLIKGTCQSQLSKMTPTSIQSFDHFEFGQLIRMTL